MGATEGIELSISNCLGLGVKVGSKNETMTNDPRSNKFFKLEQG